MQTIPTMGLSRWGIYCGYTDAILLYVAIGISFSCLLYTRGLLRNLKVRRGRFWLTGATTKVFFMVFPLLKPISMTVLILDFMNIWNDINIPLYFLSSPSKCGTMPLSVYQFSNWNYVFADLTLTIPLVFIGALFAQKTYYQWTDRKGRVGSMFSAAGGRGKQSL